MVRTLPKLNNHYGGEFINSDFYPSVGSTYETSDGHKLEYRGGGKFIDEYGNAWHSTGGRGVSKD